MSAITSTKPLRQIANVRDLLSNQQAHAQLAAVAARHLNPSRMMRIMANAVRTTPKLAECDPMSLLGALMECAALGLEPNTRLGHAYLIPFKNNKKNTTEVQLIIGYKGFIDLARRSGSINSIHADVVYDDDDLWSYEHGSDLHLRHRPGPRKGEKIAAYCHVSMPDGQAFVVLPWAKVMEVRDGSQAYRTAVKYNSVSKSIWHLHEDRMAAKTAVRAMAASGEMPLSIEFQDAIEADDGSPDFASFAMDPASGLTIDGETGEIDDGASMVDDEQPTSEPEAKTVDEPAAEKPKRKRRTKAEIAADAAAELGKAATKATETKAGQVPEAAEENSEAEAPEVDRPFAALAERIVGEINEAPDTDEIDAILEMYGPNIEDMERDDAASLTLVRDAETARRAALA